MTKQLTTTNSPNLAFGDTLANVRPSVGTLIPLRQFKRVRELEIESVETEVLTAIKKAYAISGYKPKDTTEVMTVVKIVSREVFNYFTTLTLQEVCHAIEQGALKRFGDYAGLSAANIVNFIKGYQQSAERAEAIKLENEAKKRQNTKADPTEVEREKIAQEAAIYCFDRYAKAGVLSDAGNAIYLYLERKGIISYTNEQKAKIVKGVKAKMLSKKEFELKNTPPGDKRDALRQLINSITAQDKTGKGQLKAACRYATLKQYYDKLIKTNKHIKDILHP